MGEWAGGQVRGWVSEWEKGDMIQIVSFILKRFYFAKNVSGKANFNPEHTRICIFYNKEKTYMSLFYLPRYDCVYSISEFVGPITGATIMESRQKFLFLDTVRF